METKDKKNESNEQTYFINNEKTEYEKNKALGVLNGKKLAKIKNLSSTEIPGAELSKSAKFVENENGNINNDSDNNQSNSYNWKKEIIIIKKMKNEIF